MIAGWKIIKISIKAYKAKGKEPGGWRNSSLSPQFNTNFGKPWMLWLLFGLYAQTKSNSSQLRRPHPADAQAFHEGTETEEAAWVLNQPRTFGRPWAGFIQGLLGYCLLVYSLRLIPKQKEISLPVS